MKRVLRLMIRLYPAWWRNRYGGELEALLEDSGSHDVCDLLRGAMEMQMKTWSFGRIVTVCGIVGVLLVGGIVFSMPYPYSSTAVLTIPAGDEPADVINHAAWAVLTGNSLARIITAQNLYVQERKRMPMEDVIEVMRRDIHVTPMVLARGKTKINGIAVRFDYPDSSKTQQVTRMLVERFADFQVLDAPSTPQRIRENYYRFRLVAIGLLAGLFSGVALALLSREFASRGDGPALAGLHHYGLILTPVSRFSLCFAISVLAIASTLIIELWILPNPGLMRDHLDIPLARRFDRTVLLPFEYLVEGFRLRSTVISIVVGFLFCAATWTGILYAFCALIESSLRKITHRTSSPEC